MGRATIVVVLVSWLLAGCGWKSLSPQPCLSGPIPRVGQPEADEAFAFIRREWERAQEPSW